MLSPIGSLLLVSNLSVALPQDPNDLFQLRFQVDSDLADGLPSANVSLSGANGVESLVADANGFTPFVPQDYYGTFDVFLHEMPTALGETLGQAFTWTCADTVPQPGGVHTMRIAQPEARGVHFRSSNPVGDSEHTGWRMVGYPGTSYDFQGLAAYMGSSFQIGSYFEYHGVAGMPAFRQGLLIRTTQNIDLGNQGALIEFDTQNIDYPSDPIVDTVYVGSQGSGLLGSSLVAYYGAYPPGEEVPVQPEHHAYVRIYGQLQAGDNLILLSHPGLPIQAAMGPTRLPNKRVSALGGSGTTYSNELPCTPVSPDPCSGNASCDVSGPPAGSDCSTTYTNTISSEGDAFCLPSNTGYELTFSIEFRVGYSTSVTVTLPGGEVSESINTETATTRSWTATFSGGTEGTGHGACFQNNRCTKKKSKRCTWWEKEWFIGLTVENGWTLRRKVKKVARFSCEEISISLGSCTF